MTALFATLAEPSHVSIIPPEHPQGFFVYKVYLREGTPETADKQAPAVLY